MTPSKDMPLVAVDVGNSRIKLGEFVDLSCRPLPVPRHSATLAMAWTDNDLTHWLPSSAGDYAWAIASVNRPASNRLIEWLASRQIEHVHVLTHLDMPLAIDVVPPQTVGLDRLADAVAANCLRAPHEPAIVVDHGSAITVNLISAEGMFLGGSIMPGITMAARALHEFTDGLPIVEVTDAPEFLERSTKGAIQFGLYWGAVGAVREIIARLLPDRDDPQVFLTGGGAPALAAILGQGSRRPPVFVPHLTLAGVALAAAQAARERT
jgi:type III pantothenate kinase